MTGRSQRADPASSWGRAGESLLALLLARAEFASVELTLTAQAALRWLLVAMATCVIAMLALIAVSAVVVVALWDHFSWYPLAALALVYCGVTTLLVGGLLRSIARSRPLLSQTFAELAKDGAAIRHSAVSGRNETEDDEDELSG